MRYLLAIALSIGQTNAFAQSCTIADALVTRNWLDEGGVYQRAVMHVQLAPGTDRSHSVTVQAGLRFHYHRLDGWSNLSSATVRETIDPGRRMFADLTATAVVRTCGKDKPCVLDYVEIEDIRCD